MTPASAGKAASSSSAKPALVLIRVAIGIMFLFFAEYKLASTDFARHGYAQYVGNYVNKSAVSFYKPFLRLTLLHAIASGYAVAVAELLIGLSLVLGAWVRYSSMLGALFMLNLVLCTWNGPGPGPLWRYFGYQLDNIPLLMLFLLFIVYNAGGKWGLDARSTRR
jgi:thiosulfate dehydrogenase [quinone] large subunit